MFRPDGLSQSGNSTEDTPVAGSPKDPTQARASAEPRTVKSPLSRRAQKNRNTHRGVAVGGAALLAMTGAITAATIEHGPQAPSDGIELTDPTQQAVYKCLREQFYLRSEQSLTDSDDWLNRHCRNSSNDETKDAMGRIDGSEDPLDTTARLRDAILLQAGISPGPEEGRPNLVRWVSHPTSVDDSDPMTVMEIADKKAAEKAEEEGRIVITYVNK